MKYLQNLHTHTKYCDGKNSAEEMVERAIELGFESLGFSGHAPMPDSIPAAYAMTKEDVPKYIAEIDSLKEKYADKFAILGGICVQSAIGIMPTEQLGEEIRRVFKNLKGQRWICCTSHFVQDHCTIDDLTYAYDLIYKLARE